MASTFPVLIRLNDKQISLLQEYYRINYKAVNEFSGYHKDPKDGIFSSVLNNIFWRKDLIESKSPVSKDDIEIFRREFLDYVENQALLRRLLPPHARLVAEQTLQAFEEACGSVTLPVPMSEWRDLTSDEVAEIGRIALHFPWRERKRSDTRSPFEWVRDHYREFIPGLTMKHLASDKQLYQAFAQRVKRDGLPNWLDVPNEKDASLRRIADPDERLKRVGVREWRSRQRRKPDDPNP